LGSPGRGENVTKRWIAFRGEPERVSAGRHLPGADATGSLGVRFGNYGIVNVCPSATFARYPRTVGSTVVDSKWTLPSANTNWQ
jgi:hypothetical protein